MQQPADTLADFTAGREFHPAPKTLYLISITIPITLYAHLCDLSIPNSSAHRPLKFVYLSDFVQHAYILLATIYSECYTILHSNSTQYSVYIKKVLLSIHAKTSSAKYDLHDTEHAAVKGDSETIMENTAQQTKPAENKMGTMPVGKLLLQISLPIIISMLIQAMYNIVDSMYVSRINEEALTAVSLIFPMQNLMISIATGTCVGINALLSRALGAKEFHQANRIAQHAIFLTVISSVIVSAFMLVMAVPFMRVQTSDPMIFQYGVTYMRICGGICFGIFFQVCMERLLTSTGKTIFTMTSQMTGAILNIIFDPILIFGIGPFPKMGVAGAAYATIFGQCVAALLGFWLNLRYNKEISLSMRRFRPNGHLIGTIYKIGIPSIVMTSIGSVMTFGMNMIFMQFLGNPTGAAVFGIYFKLNSIFFMPVFGLNNGVVPIVAFNYGARHRKRIMETTKLGVLAAVCLMLAGLAAFWLIPDKLLALFNASENMLSIGVPALRIISLSFIFAGYCIIVGSTMQALGKAVYSMINSLTRQLVVLLPSAFILAALTRDQGGMPAIWYSYIIAELVSVALTTFFFRRVYKNMIAPLPE